MNEDKAIVSDIHGTTRDVIEDTVNIGGITFRFIDTAGIRETNDTIESLGIERTFQKLDQAEIVLWMVDAVNAASQIEQLSEKIIPRCEGKHLIVVFNKADLIEDKQKDEIFSALLASGKTVEEQADQSPADRKDATGSLYLSGGGFQFFPTDHRQCGRDCFGSQGVNCRESLRA